MERRYLGRGQGDSIVVNRDKMIAQLILHEGIRLAPYLDTMGNWTIGVGYNITGRGITDLESVCARSLRGDTALIRITRDEALAMLAADIQRVQRAVIAHMPTFPSLNEIRQRVCVDLAFNIGWHALDFKRCIAAITRSDWSQAARELYTSRWALQVGDGQGGRRDRCDRLAGMLLTGTDYTT